MHFKFRHLDKLVGGFFIISVVSLILLMVVVARGRHWFERYVPYYSMFNSGRGLNIGDPVMIKGLKTGKVISVRLEQGNNVKVEYKILAKHSDLITDGVNAQVSAPVVGSASVVINLGQSDKPILKSGSQIPSVEESGGGLDELIADADILVKKLKDPDGNFMDTLANLKDATGDLKKTMAGKGSLGQLITKSDLYDRFLKIAKHLQVLSETLDETSPDMRDAVVAARRDLEEAEKVIKALQKSIFLRGSIEQYLGDERLLTGAEGSGATHR